MKIKELREKSAKELQVFLKECQEKVRQLSFDLAAKKLKNPNEITNEKRTIARIFTILQESESQNNKK